MKLFRQGGCCGEVLFILATETITTAAAPWRKMFWQENSKEDEIKASNQ